MITWNTVSMAQALDALRNEGDPVSWPSHPGTSDNRAAKARQGAVRAAVASRRWPNRAALVVAAMRQHVRPGTRDVPDTGSLREDVLSLLRRASFSFGELGSVGPDLIRGLASELQDVRSTEVFLVMTDAMLRILGRAAARGEVRLERITPRVAALPADLVRHEILVTHAPVPEQVLVEIVDDIFLPLVSSQLRWPKRGMPRYARR